MSDNSLGNLPYSKDNIVTEFGSWGYDFQRWQQELILINQCSFEVNSAIVPKYQSLVSYFAAVYVFYDELSPIIAEKYKPAVVEMDKKLVAIKLLKESIEKKKNFGANFTSSDCLKMRDLINGLKTELYTSKLKAGLGVPLKKMYDNLDRFKKAAQSQ